MPIKDTRQIPISKQSARRLILACQNLYPPRSLEGKTGALKLSGAGPVDPI